MNGLDRVIVWHDYFTRDENGKKVLYKKGAKTVIVGWRGEERIVAFAKCAVGDQYDRKKGRIIAEGRLKKWLSLKVLFNVNGVEYYKDQFAASHFNPALPDWLLLEKTNFCSTDEIPF